VDNQGDERIRRFFAGYEEGANSFDPERVASEYAEQFMLADPNGVVVRANDDQWRAGAVQAREFFSSIGFKAAKILSLEATALDERYWLVKVHWSMRFEPEPGQPITHEFDYTYVLFDRDDDLRVVLAISHEDEQQAMRDLGLVPSEGR